MTPERAIALVDEIKAQAAAAPVNGEEDVR